MGIEINRESPLSGPSPMQAPGGAIPANARAGEIAPREVVRCQECQLVQFRTASDLCRRCAQPLPSLLPFRAAEESAAIMA